MTNDEQQPIHPSKKDRMRPAELLGFSAVLSVFAMLIVLMSTRDWKLALICFGIAFIVVLVVVALAGLGMKPNPEDAEARKRLDEDPDSTDRPE